MSNFLGIISELPNVCVDYFKNLECSTYFLTHCHTDHMQGLRDRGFVDLLRMKSETYLYCSAITKLIISQFKELADLMDKVIELNFLTRVHIPASDKYNIPYHVVVSCIPAGHCPGSVMFLFESATKCVLYTGDFRIAEGDTTKFKQLHNGKTVKSIDCMYLDATFLSEFYWHFSPRDKSIAVIVDEIGEWLSKGPKRAVKIMLSAKYGQEAAIMSVSEALRCKIHVPNYVFHIYSHVPEVISALTNECSSTRIHSDFKNSTEPCVSLSSNVLCIYPTAQAFPCRKGCEPKVKLWVSPNHLKVNYSSHSPGSAIEDFLLSLRPKKIVPCTEAVGSTSEKRDSVLNSIMSNWEEVEDFQPIEEIVTEKSVEHCPESLHKRPFRPKIPEFNLKHFSLDSSGESKSGVGSLDGFSWSSWNSPENSLDNQGSKAKKPSLETVLEEEDCEAARTDSGKLHGLDSSPINSEKVAADKIKSPAQVTSHHHLNPFASERANLATTSKNNSYEVQLSRNNLGFIANTSYKKAPDAAVRKEYSTIETPDNFKSHHVNNSSQVKWISTVLNEETSIKAGNNHHDLKTERTFSGYANLLPGLEPKPYGSLNDFRTFTSYKATFDSRDIDFPQEAGKPPVKSGFVNNISCGETKRAGPSNVATTPPKKFKPIIPESATMFDFDCSPPEG